MEKPITDGFTNQVMNLMSKMLSPNRGLGVDRISNVARNRGGTKSTYRGPGKPAGTKMIRRAEKSMIGRSSPLGLAGESIRQIAITRNLAMLAQRKLLL